MVGARLAGIKTSGYGASLEEVKAAFLDHVTAAARKKFGPPTDAGTTNFVRSTQAHSGLQCPELAQLRPQIVPWSTLCRADWVMIQSLPRAADCYATATQCARPCGSVRASGSIIDRPGQKGAIASRPAHDHWMNSPSSGRIQPTIHCDECTFVDQFIACRRQA